MQEFVIVDTATNRIVSGGVNDDAALQTIRQDLSEGQELLLIEDLDCQGLLRQQATHVEGGKLKRVERRKPNFFHEKIQRNGLLRDTDKFMVEDFPIDQATRDAWKEYRQKLRDMFAGLGPGDSVVWPEPPGNIF